MARPLLCEQTPVIVSQMRLAWFGKSCTHDFDSSLSSQPVKLDPVGYLSAVSGPTQSPDSICHNVCRVQQCVLLPHCSKKCCFNLMWTPHTSSFMKTVLTTHIREPLFKAVHPAAFFFFSWSLKKNENISMNWFKCVFCVLT